MFANITGEYFSLNKKLQLLSQWKTSLWFFRKKKTFVANIWNQPAFGNELTIFSPINQPAIYSFHPEKREGATYIVSRFSPGIEQLIVWILFSVAMWKNHCQINLQLNKYYTCENVYLFWLIWTSIKRPAVKDKRQNVSSRKILEE